MSGKEKRPFFSYREFMLKRYGESLHRIPIDLAFNCPNREVNGSGGCSFCPPHAARARQTFEKNSVAEQIGSAIQFAKKRYTSQKFLAFFQTFSAQFQAHQLPQYMDVLKSAPFEAVCFATRPDCLIEEAYSFFIDLQKQKEVWVELGVQTVKNSTLERINRRHTWEQSAVAIRKLNQIGIKVVPHVIIGLPGEGEKDFYATAKTLASLPISGIKIHNLHIIKGALLEKEFEQEAFPVFNEFEYGEFLMQFLRYLPPQIPILRINTDTPASDRLAPIWKMDKSRFRHYVVEQMKYRNWHQGDFVSPGKKHIPDKVFKAVVTKDGSLTFYNKEFNCHYHPQTGARRFVEDNFLQPSQLTKKAGHRKIRILDIGFGPGYCSLLALNRAVTNGSEVEIFALERDMRVVTAASRKLLPHPEDKYSFSQALTELLQKNYFGIRNSFINILWGEARFTIDRLDGKFDLVFLHTFPFYKNCELLTLEFFVKIKKLLNPAATFMLSARDLPVRNGLFEAGFYVAEIGALHAGGSGTIAVLTEQSMAKPIIPENMGQLKGVRGNVYRDPDSIMTVKEILRAREMANNAAHL
ncbi:TIGR01212 family radical SAM protein [Candidatus Riflebacteria bacterium]